jgi:hypothetical protein
MFQTTNQSCLSICVQALSIHLLMLFGSKLHQTLASQLPHRLVAQTLLVAIDFYQKVVKQTNTETHWLKTIM